MKTPWIMMACLSLFAAAGCDLPDKDIGDETMGDSGKPGDACEPGEMVPAADGCNTCVCDEDGSLACTEIACEPEPEPCVPGEEFMDEDGCNTCTCEADGTATCTLIDCGPVNECEPGATVPADDGCNTCTCLPDGTVGPCTEKACDGPYDSTALSTCQSGEVFDPIESVDGVELDGDTLTISVSVGGGCEPHFFAGCWEGAFLTSDPTLVQIDIAHESNDDACEAILDETVVIDLQPLRTAYIDAYGSGATLQLEIAGWPEAVPYTL